MEVSDTREGHLCKTKSENWLLQLVVYTAHFRTRQTVIVQNPTLLPNQTEVKSAAGVLIYIKMMALAIGSNGALWNSVSLVAKKMDTPVNTEMPQQFG